MYQLGLIGYYFMTTHSVEAFVAHGVAVKLSADGMMGYQMVMTHCCFYIVAPH